MQTTTQTQFQCASGIRVRRSAVAQDYGSAMSVLGKSLDTNRGVLLASSFEYPGRYTRWDIGFVNPPVQFIGRGRELEITALNVRGEILLPEIYHALKDSPVVKQIQKTSRQILVTVIDDDTDVAEELRSRRPSLFSILREIIACFSSAVDPYLGLYGAFGYDLTFQFEDVKRFQQRDATDRDLVLYLPDQITVADHRIGRTLCYNYEFVCRSWDTEARTETTGGYRRSGTVRDYKPATAVPRACDHAPGEFTRQVERALAYFRRGDLFEVVPGQTFFEPCKDRPSQVFARLQKANPAPYGALMNLGESEYLVAASPEMFVRVEGKQIETCPISGTIRRGADAIADAQQIKELLNSAKDESELSMCTDVDRNDKARVCVPGSVKVVGRRQIEMYSRLIHTVDHVKGVLQDQFDALDGFLAHTWAVTVTGAPKLAAMQFIEEFERSPRRWYGGAIGHLGFDGNINTGLTLRTTRIKDGVAEVRAGATLLIDSDPEDEEKETRLKASALLAAIRGDVIRNVAEDAVADRTLAAGLRVLMVDHQDSFVHNLASYFRQYGVELITLRPQSARHWLQQHTADLVILSPGPSAPAHFDMAKTIAAVLATNTPLFGVCLGLQGLVEYFGGQLAELDYPMHGKPSVITHTHSDMFAGIDREFTAGRYHSLVATRVPACLQVTARTADGHVMAIEHESLPISAVQFHPESILSLDKQAGQQLIRNVIANVLALRGDARQVKSDTRLKRVS